MMMCATIARALARAHAALRNQARQIRHLQLDALRQMQAQTQAQDQAHAQAQAKPQRLPAASPSQVNPADDWPEPHMQACALEGAWATTTARSGLTAMQLAALADTQADDWWLDLLMPCCIGMVIAFVAAVHLGLV